MEAIGSGQRIVVQLALVRAPESWLSADIRKSVEHALQPERDERAASMKHVTTRSDIAEGARLLAMIVAFIGSVFAFRWYQQHAWLQLMLLGIALAIGVGALLWWKLFRKRPPIYDMKLVAEKMAKAGFYSHLRVIVIGHERMSTTAELSAHLWSMEVVYRQFTLASSNSLYLKRTRFLHAGDWQARQLTSACNAFPYASPLLRLLHGGAYSWQVLSSLELSGMFHLPQEMTDLPLVRRVASKGLLASPEIAHQIKQQPSPLPPALVGYSHHRRHHVPVYLPFEVLFSHMFFAGMSRSGKSVLLQVLTSAAMQPLQPRAHDMPPQPGVFVADPHRDLIMDLLKLVPPLRTQDVLLLDMTDTQFPVALNPLDASMGFTRDQAVGHLMSCFQKIWSEYWGPRMAYFLNAVCLLLYTLNERLVQQGRAEEQYTLLDINPLLQYKDYATQVLSQLDINDTWHQEIFAWWQHTYFALPTASTFRQEIIMPILSKIGVFSENAHLRRIVGQPVTKAPVHLAVTEGKIVLCALSARDMDDNAVNILGSTLINLLHRSFSLQQHLPLRERRKVCVAIDEFQNFSGSDFEKLLSEDAKYGCALLLSTQSLKRFTTIRHGLLEMVFSNCQHLWVFRISAEDAKLMETELQEKVTVKHIISQPPIHCYARLAIPGYPLQIISVALIHPASWKDDPSHEKLVQAIRQTNACTSLSASEVDRRYGEHLHRFLDVSASAARLQREARAALAQKQQREAAAQRAQDLAAAQLVTTTKQPSQPTQGREVTSGTPRGSSHPHKQPSQPTQGGEVAEGTTSGPPHSQKDEVALPDMDESKPVDNHRRSRRMGKKRSGGERSSELTSPPVPSPQPTPDHAAEHRPRHESLGTGRGTPWNENEASVDKQGSLKLQKCHER